MVADVSHIRVQHEEPKAHRISSPAIIGSVPRAMAYYEWNCAMPFLVMGWLGMSHKEEGKIGVASNDASRHC